MPIDWTLILPALAAGLCVLLSHVPLGQEVLRRGIIFIDLAIAQFAGLGLIVASLFGSHLDNVLFVQLIAFSSALFGALLLSLMERWLLKQGSDKQHLEALIGICFVLAATGSILLLSQNVHSDQHLKEILIGQILWTEWSQLVVPLIVGTSVLALRWLKPKLFQGWWFYPIFALAITISVQLVGVYLVFASLIIPALVTRLMQLSFSASLVVGIALGLSSYLAGLVASSIYDLPSGAIIVWSMAVIGLLATVFAHKQKPAST